MNRALERRSHELAHNVVVDLASEEASVFRHSPPEVKGMVLDNILYDCWVTPDLWGLMTSKPRPLSN